MSRQTLAVVETGIAIALWAVSFVFIKVALREVSPPTLIVFRFSLGAVILGSIAALRGEWRGFRRADLPGLVGLGLVGVAIQQALQVAGQTQADAGVAAFLAATAPAFLALLGSVFLRERLRWGQAFGILLATLGAGLVAGGGDWQAVTGGRAVNWGNGLVLLSAVVWAIYSLLSRRFGRGQPATRTSAGMMFFGTLFTLPWLLATGSWVELGALTPGVWGALICTGLLSTTLTYLLYNHALSLAPASRLAAIQTIEPLIAMLAAALLIGEAITVVLALGGAAIVAGVFLAEGGAAADYPSASPDAAAD